MYLGLGSWRLQCFWTWPFVSSNRAFVLDETDYVWSALSCVSSTTCTSTHTHTYIHILQASWHVDPYLWTTSCKPMLRHICVCICVWVTVCWRTGASVFSQQYDILQEQSQLQETSELKFHLTVTPWPLPGTSEHRCFLFNNTTMFALSEELSLLLFKKKFKAGRNL